MNEVTVYHMIMDRATGGQLFENNIPMFVEVAHVMVPQTVDDTTALEFAWRWTNNIEGSWSAGKRNYSNPDYNPSVVVVEPLEVIDGDAYGHRSSMVGDIFAIRERIYKVGMMGFERIE